jgi:hypothetical protein
MFGDVDLNRAGPGLPVTRQRTPSSRVLEDLLRQAPPDHFTLGWVLSTLHQSPGGNTVDVDSPTRRHPVGPSTQSDTEARPRLRESPLVYCAGAQ